MVSSSHNNFQAFIDKHHRPYIEQANEDAPTFARIFKEMVLITDPAKPLPRAAKGNIVRKYALDLYADAIERL